MAVYIMRRLLWMVLVMWGVSTAVFIILRLSGDPALLFASQDSTPEEINRIREALGFNDPVAAQYGRFLQGAATGNFGQSLRFNSPALPLVMDRLPATMELTFASLLISALVGIPAGIVAATRRNSLYDNLSMVGTLLGQCMPVFWLGIMLIWLFAVELQVLPASGRGSLGQLILPALTLGAYSMARIARLTRSCMLEVLGQDYIRTARAKGLHEMAVVYLHALKNASISIVTIVGFTVATLLGGAVITETIFAWPGVGRLLVQAVHSRDYPLVQASVFVIAFIVATINLLTDLFYAYLDPRIRYQ